MNRQFVLLHYAVIGISVVIFLCGFLLFAYIERVYGDGLVSIHDSAGRVTGYVGAASVRWISLLVTSLLSLSMLFIARLSLVNYLKKKGSGGN